jgi:hypothetical protein
LRKKDLLEIFPRNYSYWKLLPALYFPASGKVHAETRGKQFQQIYGESF